LVFYAAVDVAIFVALSPERGSPLAWAALVVVIAGPPLALAFALQVIAWILAVLVATVLLSWRAVRYIAAGR
jgi:lysylphosphatidylglycerol synthetase-like protein (DUF2156 family)